MAKTFFERYPKMTVLGLWVILGALGLSALELVARHCFGLGNVVIYENSVIYGYRLRPNQQVVRKDKAIKINNLGFRAETEWDPLPDNKILFLGDSVTYGGSYIANHELFSHLAVQSIPGMLAGNAGVNGWGVNNVAAFATHLNPIPAKTIVTVFPEGDFYRGLQRLGGQPFWTHSPHYGLEELFHYFIYKISLKKSLSPFYTEYSDEERTSIVEIAVQNLKELDDYLKSQGCQHLIYISPSRSQINFNLPVDPIIKTLLEKYQVKVTYLKDKIIPLQNSEKNAIFRDEIHLSELGHQYWAKLIAQDLQTLIANPSVSNITEQEKLHENKIS